MSSVIAGVLKSYAKDKHGVGYPYINGTESVDEAFEAMQKDYLKHAVIFEEYGKNGLAWDDSWKSEFGGVSEEEIKEAEGKIIKSYYDNGNWCAIINP